MIHNKWEPNWGAFVNWMGMFYEAGEYGVIYTDKRTPYQLIKVVNTDITDGDANYDQAEFFEDNWKRNIEGLVKVYSYTSCEAKSGIMNPLVGNVVRATSEDAQEILRVLDMDVGDNLAMWVMVKAN